MFFVFTAGDFARFFSKRSYFDQVLLEMPVDKVQHILDDGDIGCNLRLSDLGQCQFSDFWRDYRIGLDAQRKTVTIKSVSIKPRKTPSRWLLDGFLKFDFRTIPRE